MTYDPKYTITINIANNLMAIQDASTLVSQLPLPTYILHELKHNSLVETILYSTKIEGNLLDEKSKRDAIKQPGELKEEQEVYNLWKGMQFLEQCESRGLPITEDLIKQLHAIIDVIVSGRRPKHSQYRVEQNKVGEKGTGRIVYLPPEPQDVPTLMEDLVAWVNSSKSISIPVPIRAGIFLFQFLTIHPYMDGNGRTGRALVTYLLRMGGLGLDGLFVLEKYYDRNLKGYYDNLQMGLHHNYYFGRHEADITSWLDFFTSGMAEVFQDAAKIVRARSSEFMAVEPKLLRSLDIYQRAVFAQLAFKFNYLTTSDLHRITGFADRTIRDKVKTWIEAGFIEPSDPKAKRIRAIKLTKKYQRVADEIAKEPDKYKCLLT